MRKFFSIAVAVALLVVSAAAAFPAQPATKTASGKIVIVFKDGHRQVFNLADIERVEFPLGAVATADAGSSLPSRGHFLGKWEVGDGNGRDFYITLKENGEAWRSLREVRGRWMYVDGEARVTWDDGAQDAIRKVGSSFQKFAYGPGKAFTDAPDNVTSARNLTPHGS